jgi:anti-anti-sigma factor
MLELGLDVRRDGGTAVVTVRGELDVVSVPQVERLLIALLDDHPPAVAVDLSRVEFVDSAGVEALARLRSHYLSCGAELGLVNPPRLACRLIDLLGLSDALPATATPTSRAHQHAS